MKKKLTSEKSKMINCKKWDRTLFIQMLIPFSHAVVTSFYVPFNFFVNILLYYVTCIYAPFISNIIVYML